MLINECPGIFSVLIFSAAAVEQSNYNYLSIYALHLGKVLPPAAADDDDLRWSHQCTG